MNDQPKPSPGQLPTGRIRANRHHANTGPTDTLTETQIRDILRPHRDGGPISRLYATGEIGPDTIPELGVAAAEFEGAEADRLDDVIRYAAAVGERPPVARWLGSHGRGQQ